MDDTIWHDAGERAGLPPGTIGGSQPSLREFWWPMSKDSTLRWRTPVPMKMPLCPSVPSTEKPSVVRYTAVVSVYGTAGRSMSPPEIDLETYSVDIRNDRIQIAQRR
ncbi:MAG: hypothetical protein Ct9H300mP16_08740 [Pseudomonadota bacterium]|nr:MAG: hypothetical protein Ct9H300mP16_08740 [Pseudomonadota bacterium]